MKVEYQSTKLMLVAIALFGMSQVALAEPRTDIPAPLLPTVKCIYDVLKSSTIVKSVDVYSIDGARFGFEYAFNDKDGQPAVSYVELVAPNLDARFVFLGDKIPREVPEYAMEEGSDLESNLQLGQKCHIESAFDNLLPQPTARATWHHIDLPKDFR